ncbi:MAG TPA: sodium:proton antiporter [Victivallales bacterium]|nr:sodium:proton antiporter [Victivallales bacterium]
MSGEFLVNHILLVLALLLLAAGSAIFFRKIKFPYTIGLVVVGILLALIINYIPKLSSLTNVLIFHDIIYYILLPTLIFDAAVNIDSRLLFKNLLPVFALAAPGLVISTILVGFFIHATTPLAIGAALLFGSLISATDPVAVIALFKDIGAPKRLTILVDGESLFNDATAIVLFNIIIAIIITGTHINGVTISLGILNFLLVFIGGLFTGAVIGLIAVLIINLSRKEPLTPIAISTVLAFASFIIADHYLKVSGVMSALGAGIVVSWYGGVKFTNEVKQYLLQFWEYAAFVANSFIFLLLGLVEWRLIYEIGHSDNLFRYILYAILAVIVARLLVVYGIIPILKFFPKYEKIDLKYQTIIFWGGLRGAVPLALAFSLSSSFPGHKLIIELTLGVVLFTLLIQGTTTKLLIKWFKLDQLSLFEKIMCYQAKLISLAKGKEIINKLKSQKYLSAKELEVVNKSYDEANRKTKIQLDELQNDPEFKSDTIRKLLWYEAVSIEKNAYKLLFERGLISESVIRELLINIELQRDGIKSGKLPEVNLCKLPFELKLKGFVYNIFKFISPKSKFVRRIKYRTIVSKYEMTLAMITANNHIRSIFGRMPEMFGLQREIVIECQDFYKLRAEKSIQQRKKLEHYIAKFNLQRQTIYRAVINAEMDSIKDLELRGNIPFSVASILTDDIEKKISTIAKRNHSFTKADLKI